MPADAGSVTTDPGSAPGDKGLKADALGFREALAIGLDSTAPAYSLAAVIGIIVVTVGLQAPAVLLLAFVPMFLTSVAFAALNRADPDCGTTFSWTTRAMGPFIGWVTGWAVCITGVLVIGSLAEVAASYSYLLFGLDSAADSKGAVTALTVVIIIAMTTLTAVGTELTGKLQIVLVFLQVGFLLVFAIVALIKVFADTAPEGSLDPSLSWFNPFDISSFGALAAAMLTAVFIYWGWESAVTVNEEVRDSATAPGKAAVLSTSILLVTYLLVAVAVIAYAGQEGVTGFEDDIGILADQAKSVLGSPLDKIVIIAVLTSALASTQTTILPASRTILSMARRGAMPAALGRIHPTWKTPHIATFTTAVIATAYYVPLKLGSENFLFDTIASLGIVIAFYYAMTGFTCVIYYREQLFDSPANLFRLLIGPLVGGTILAAIFVKALVDFSRTADASSEPILGVAPPLLIGGGMLVLGVVLALVWRVVGPKRFWAERPSVAPAIDPEPVIASRV